MSTPSQQIQTGGSADRAISTPRKLFTSKLYKETVTLVIKETKEEYTLHRELLCSYSDFFHAALQGSFQEASTSRMELSVEPRVLQAFQVWLYSRSLRNAEGIAEKSKAKVKFLCKEEIPDQIA
ncbi:hypothetical protein AUEXF2481DRAFT_112 [Aureobasidium subglaciale EXF-2481]|uniref:BTB domain-containing protein n=1 Tax=Aureobasidium subglaciale (strain EXF-2481) TaxID=1043005 RepID=A0A074YQZ4_AURSE|nr:uncharacterized protein AUEXF2481DRAFT_112 [Aureobasidium subglaciale EXF-2481]KAI5212218.1 hypothetical protein E4T38_00821 [Aureobasidium subglaciale]KAI5231321.1 hypothetical protein E4T40_00822 [Aureobasidium subglaciale]KAI5234090.1 hypothetical protein E4T41_00820 [Aureobasidium subglaciale]KAI5267504.1 hypothetical protein E4T46_00820 [Aureobasidium subglaciale]KER00149.1 hypothetical protein AUEXF2481DRAFT_112 [Aureobasidium subglaciale EXF-2481]